VLWVGRVVDDRLAIEEYTRCVTDAAATAGAAEGAVKNPCYFAKVEADHVDNRTGRRFGTNQ
jgi:hypothetical protein